MVFLYVCFLVCHFHSCLYVCLCLFVAAFGYGCMFICESQQLCLLALLLDRTGGHQMTKWTKSDSFTQCYLNSVVFIF